jgi:hypothetical protein
MEFLVDEALTLFGVEGGLGFCPVVEVEPAELVVPGAAVVAGAPVVAGAAVVPVVTPGKVVASTETKLLMP